MKHQDQAKREVIPTRADLPTQFHPCQDLLMVIPVPDIKQVGSILLPERATIVLNEGHIVEKGPSCTAPFSIGDCVTWDKNSEYRMNVDGVDFILVREGVISMVIPHAELIQKYDPQQPSLQCGDKGCGGVCLFPLGHGGAHVYVDNTLTEGEDEERGGGVGKAGVYQCLACGQSSPIEYSAINHAVGCPEHMVEQMRKGMA